MTATTSLCQNWPKPVITKLVGTTSNLPCPTQGPDQISRAPSSLNGPHRTNTHTPPMQCRPQDGGLTGGGFFGLQSLPPQFRCLRIASNQRQLDPLRSSRSFRIIRTLVSTRRTLRARRQSFLEDAFVGVGGCWCAGQFFNCQRKWDG